MYPMLVPCPDAVPASGSLIDGEPAVPVDEPVLHAAGIDVEPGDHAEVVHVRDKRALPGCRAGARGVDRGEPAVPVDEPVGSAAAVDVVPDRCPEVVGNGQQGVGSTGHVDRSERAVPVEEPVLIAAAVEVEPGHHAQVVDTDCDGAGRAGHVDRRVLPGRARRRVGDGRVGGDWHQCQRRCGACDQQRSYHASFTCHGRLVFRVVVAIS